MTGSTERPIPDEAKARRAQHSEILLQRGLEAPRAKIRVVEAKLGSPLLEVARKEVAKRYMGFAREGLTEEDVYEKLFVSDPYMDPTRSRTLVALDDNTNGFLGTIQLTFGEEENQDILGGDSKPLRAIEAISLMHPPHDPEEEVTDWPHRIGDNRIPETQIGELGRLAIIPGVTRELRAQILRELTYEVIRVGREERNIRQVYAIMPSFVYSLFEEAEVIPQQLAGAELNFEDPGAAAVYEDFPKYWKRSLRAPKVYRFLV